MDQVPAHDQRITNSYVVHYPPHPPREGDPHYKDFNHIHREWKKDPTRWVCAVGKERGDFSDCDLSSPLELHHSHVEFSLQNGIELKWLEASGLYSGIGDPESVGAWVESAANLIVLCVKHHRGVGGIHHASASDFEAEKFVRDLIDKAARPGSA